LAMQYHLRLGAGSNMDQVAVDTGVE